MEKVLYTYISQSHAHSCHLQGCPGHETQTLQWISNNKSELKIKSETISCFGNVVLILKANMSLNVVLGMTAYKPSGTTLQLQLHKLAEHTKLFVPTFRPWHVKWKFRIMGEIPTNRWLYKTESRTESVYVNNLRICFLIRQFNSRSNLVLLKKSFLNQLREKTQYSNIHTNIISCVHSTPLWPIYPLP